MSPEAQDDVLSGLVSSTTQRHSLYCHRGFIFKKLELGDSDFIFKLIIKIVGNEINICSLLINRPLWRKT